MNVQKKEINNITNNELELLQNNELITIGVSVVTKEKYYVIQDNKAIELAVEDDIVFLSIPKDMIEIVFNDLNKEIIANLLEYKGYPKKFWTVVDKWISSNIEII